MLFVNDAVLELEDETEKTCGTALPETFSPTSGTLAALHLWQWHAGRFTSSSKGPNRAKWHVLKTTQS